MPQNRDKVARREQVEAAIRSAFAGVTLGSGVSLRQAESIDGTIFGLEPMHHAPDRDEVTDDWTRVPEAELLRDNIAHLDPDGLRYYLPALLLWLLDHYDDRPWADGDMTRIGTMHAIAPDAEFARSHWAVYDSFTSDQPAALALYVHALPVLVHLDYEDSVRVPRSIDQYWHRFLPPS
jgi:hypothetical protein